MLGWQPWPFSPQATRLARLEARKDASKSLEKKVLQKAMEDAKVRGCWCWAVFFVGRFVSPGVCFFLEKQIECLVHKFMSSFRDDLGPQSTWEPQIPWYGRVMSWSGTKFQKNPKQIHRCLNHHSTFSYLFTMKSYNFPAFLVNKASHPPSPRPKLSWAQRPRPKPLPRPKLRKSPRQRFGHDLVRNGAQKCSNLAKVGWKFSPNMSQLLGSWCLMMLDDAWFILMFVFVLLMSNYLDVICWDLRMSWSGPMVLMWVDMKSPCRGTFALAEITKLWRDSRLTDWPQVMAVVRKFTIVQE